jgi:hypothetical protein
MNRLSILILGAGGMGRRHIKAFAQTSRCDVYCFDVCHAAVERIQEMNVFDRNFLGSGCSSRAIVLRSRDCDAD